MQSKALTIYLGLEKFWTPACNGNQARNEYKREFRNKINNLKQELNTHKQNINNLKIKNSYNSSSNNSSSGQKFKKVCLDCGKENEIYGHSGCPQAGKHLFMPEKFKKREEQKENSATTESANTSEEIPVNEEKMVQGEKMIYCGKYYDKEHKKQGMWRLSTEKSAHKTAQHKYKKKSNNFVEICSKINSDSATPPPIAYDSIVKASEL